ncbi:MAG: cytochrome P450 [Myxococcota bacterium]
MRQALRQLLGPLRVAGDVPSASLPPGPAEPPVVQLGRFLFDPGGFMRGAAASHGTPLTMRVGGLPPVVQFVQPDDVREVFAGSPDALHAGKANRVLEPFLGEWSVLLLDGARHRSQRKLLLPPFRGERMRAYGAAMIDVTRRAMERWPRASSGGAVIQVQQGTQDITLDIILRTVFGQREGVEERELRGRLVAMLSIADNPLWVVRALQRDLGPRSPWGRFLRARAEVFRRLDADLAERRAAGRRSEDIVSLLLDAWHEDGTPMSDAEIRDELLTLLVAGHETTATALSWTLHRLSRHPEVLRAVHGELDAVYGAAEVGPERLGELRLLDAVIKETLRVHPVVPGVGRFLMAPQRIGAWDLPAGVVAGCSVILAHENPSSWPEPRAYRPERFLEGRPPAFAFFPFGGGARRCIGEAFALYEMRAVLATVLRELVPVAAPGVRIRPVRRNVTLSPSGGCPLRFAPR